MSSRPQRPTASVANARIAATAAEQQRLEAEEKERIAALTAPFDDYIDEENSQPQPRQFLVSRSLLPLPPPPSHLVSQQLTACPLY